MRPACRSNAGSTIQATAIRMTGSLARRSDSRWGHNEWVARRSTRCAVGDTIALVIEQRAFLVKALESLAGEYDLHLLDGSISLYRPPRVLGHEVSGVVRAVGSAVSHVSPGDAVALDTSVPCNTCFYCREGRPFNCPHRIPVNAGFSEYNVVSQCAGPPVHVVAFIG